MTFLKGHKVMSVYTATHIGLRKTQEDRLINAKLPHGCLFLAVFDGTAGAEAADFACKNMASILADTESFKKFAASAEPAEAVEPVDAVKPAEAAEPADAVKPVNAVEPVDAAEPVDATKMVGDVKLLEKALSEAFAETDRQILAKCRGISVCTAVAALIHVPSSTLILANAGDSRAAFGVFEDSKLASSFITEEHRPENSAEKKRIEASGGALLYYNGGPFLCDPEEGYDGHSLGYSRALGSKKLKKVGLICDPEITLITYVPEPRRNVLVLGSDGLWDCFKLKQCLTVAHRESNPASHLVKYAVRDSTDNVTAIVAFLE